MTTLEGARLNAARVNEATDKEVEGKTLLESNKVATEIRGFLIKNEQEHTANNPVKLVRRTNDSRSSAIMLGPQIDKGLTSDHFRFDSGARLSFGITLKDQGNGSLLISYRFHFVFREGHDPQFVRFDLNPTGVMDPLLEPRCHTHPGVEEVRLPARLLAPIEVLERIFFVLETCTCKFCVGSNAVANAR